MGDPTSVVGRRIVAYIVDSIIIFAIFVVAFLALAESDLTNFDADTLERIDEAFGDSDADDEFLSTWDIGRAVGGFVTFDDDELNIGIVEGGSFWAVTLVGLAASVGFLILMQGATGATPGKAMLGIRTVREDGQPPGLGKAIVRWLLLFVDAFLILPGLITALASKGHRRIGDMAAGTYVVRKEAAGQPIVVGGTAAMAPPGGYAATAYATAPIPQQPAADAQWDAARGAWIRWDGTAWVGYDPTTGGWNQL